MYAVVRTGNKQYRVEAGYEFLVERLEQAEAGKTIELNDVLLLGEGESVEIGKPIVGAVVQCTCLGEEQGPKLRTVKYRRRKNSRRTHGHRQTYTRLRIDKIERRAS